MTSIPSHVLLIHLHPPKSRPVTQSPDYPLVFCIDANTCFSLYFLYIVKCTGHCSAVCHELSFRVTRDGKTFTTDRIWHWMSLFECTFSRCDCRLVITGTCLHKQQWRAPLVHRIPRCPLPSHLLHKCQRACAQSRRSTTQGDTGWPQP